MAQVFQDGTPVREEVEHGESTWTIAIDPVFSPRSNTLIGVLAVVAPGQEPLPEKPLVGSWEWEIERDEQGQPTLRRRTYWDRNLFRIYDVDPSVAAQRHGYWEAGEWANTLIEQADQMRVNGSIRDGIQDGLAGVTETFRCLTYNIVTGFGSSAQGRRHLRLVGVIPEIAPDDSSILLQGFSYDAPDSFHDMAFEQDANAARVDDVLRGVMELTEQPIAVLDATTLDVLMTSASWRREDFGHVGGLGEFAIDDPHELRAFTMATAEQIGQVRTRALRLRRKDGTVQDMNITVTGVTSSTQVRDVVVRLDF